jgi:hypothetical protein
MISRYKSCIGLALASLTLAAAVAILARPSLPCWIASALVSTAVADSCGKGKCFCFKNGKAKCRKCSNCG